MLESLLTHIFWSESFIHCSWTQDLMIVPFLLSYLTMCLCVKLLMNTFCSRQNFYIHTRWIQRLLVTSTSSILNLHEQEPEQSWQTIYYFCLVFFVQDCCMPVFLFLKSILYWWVGIAAQVCPVSGSYEPPVNVIILSKKCCSNVFVLPSWHRHAYIFPLSVSACGS